MFEQFKVFETTLAGRPQGGDPPWAKFPASFLKAAEGRPQR